MRKLLTTRRNVGYGVFVMTAAEYCTEVARLRAGIQALIDGYPHWIGHPNPTYAGRGQCVHEQWQHCDQCRDEYLQRLLDGEPK